MHLRKARKPLEWEQRTSYALDNFVPTIDLDGIYVQDP